MKAAEWSLLNEYNLRESMSRLKKGRNMVSIFPDEKEDAFRRDCV